ncbi:MAG: GGGtGRT protein [Cloacibacillus evryensis]
MANFEGYERRIDKINSFLAEIGFDCLEEAQQLCLDTGVACRHCAASSRSPRPTPPGPTPGEGDKERQLTAAGRRKCGEGPGLRPRLRR